MTPVLYKLNITLMESTFFASHELDNLYFTEALIGNYALAYALGLVKSPYNRTHVGYSEDLPNLNREGVYITPAWPIDKPKYRIETFNCQGESFYTAMGQNVVVEIAGRQYVTKKGQHFIDGVTGKMIRPTNRPQKGTLKLLSPQNRFECYLVTEKDVCLPSYIRLGKFMSKARVNWHQIMLKGKATTKNEFQLINPVDLDQECRIMFGDTVNIHPVPLIRRAVIDGPWWTDTNERPVVPAGLKFRGI